MSERRWISGRRTETSAAPVRKVRESYPGGPVFVAHSMGIELWLREPTL